MFLEREIENYRYFKDLYPVDDYHIELEFRSSDVTPKQALDEYPFIVTYRYNVVRKLYKSIVNSKQYDTSSVNLNILFCFADKSDTPVAKQPALVFSKESYSNNILIPSLDQLSGSVDKYLSFIDNTDISFDKKSDLACFAGSLTNVYWNHRGIEHNERLKISDLGARNKDNFICSISKPIGFGLDEWQEVRLKVKETFPKLYNSGFFSDNNPMPIPNQLQHKYLLSADGHTSAWSRVPWQMYSESVPIKVRNRHHDFIEWFYPFLDKSRHLLEIDIEDIPLLLKTLKEDQRYAQDIAEAGKDFVNRFCRQNTAIDIFFSTLLRLSNVQRTFVNG